MPYLQVRNLDFYYETVGDPIAPPLLILSGLTDYTSKCDWQTSVLAEDHFVITFDNRGAGRSATPPPGYTVADMADDAAGILDALDITRVHVFGFSLGGMIALNLVLNHPNRVHRLILGCTTAGGRLAVQPDDKVVAAMTQPVSTGNRRQDFFNGIRNSVSDRCMAEQPDLIDSLATIAEENPQTAAGYAGQIQAVLTHDVADRLEEITSPTLVLHGIDDRVIPLENGRLLAANIRGARFIEYPETGHLFFIEKAREVNTDIRSFLTGVN